MKRKSMPFHRYSPYPPVDLPDRTWPKKTISAAPVWCSVDLRDGNQALSVPMNVDEKVRMFNLLVSVGFKEIEIGFPAASQVEFDFVRRLINGNFIPEDVTVQVLTPAREHLIRRTFESLQGARTAIVHLYNSTSTTQRRVVFRQDEDGVTRIATEGARIMAECRQSFGMPGIRFEYSPESFTGTEPEFALVICEAVNAVWQPTPEQPVIINLPATVEMSTPNIYADRIEWFSRHIPARDAVIISVHTHNDRGTAVAAAELAVMAGADRVEGALFGNGERTGNMDIVTMALNLFSQGVDPNLDFSDMNNIRQVYEQCTRMTVPERHPYAGDLVFTAFSGSHQDAIHKGLKAQSVSSSPVWDVPYLPIDPQDIGRDYESIIRINSQSGKGGVAYIMERDWGFCVPKVMYPDLAQAVQQKTETTGRELASGEIYNCFRERYLDVRNKYQLVSCAIHSEGQQPERTSVQVVIKEQDKETAFKAEGNGPLDAFVHGICDAFHRSFKIVSYAEHALKQGADADAVAYVGIETGDGRTVFGVGIDSHISRASIKAVLSALRDAEATIGQSD